MGSDSDWPVMEAAAARAGRVRRAYEADVVSAHRMPHEMISYGAGPAGRGLRVIIAGAGGAAHLPGMLAAVTPLPVIGVPVPLRHLDGLDSLLSIVQMPAGVPVATVAVGGARNAGLLAVRILGVGDAALRARMTEFQEDLRRQALAKGAALRQRAGPAPLRLKRADRHPQGVEQRRRPGHVAYGCSTPSPVWSCWWGSRCWHSRRAAWPCGDPKPAPW